MAGAGAAVKAGLSTNAETDADGCSLAGAGGSGFCGLEAAGWAAALCSVCSLAARSFSCTRRAANNAALWLRSCWFSLANSLVSLSSLAVRCLSSRLCSDKAAFSRSRAAFSECKSFTFLDRASFSEPNWRVFLSKASFSRAKCSACSAISSFSNAKCSAREASSSFSRTKFSARAESSSFSCVNVSVWADRVSFSCASVSVREANSSFWRVKSAVRAERDSFSRASCSVWAESSAFSRTRVSLAVCNTALCWVSSSFCWPSTSILRLSCSITASLLLILANSSLKFFSSISFSCRTASSEACACSNSTARPSRWPSSVRSRCENSASCFWASLVWLSCRAAISAFKASSSRSLASRRERASSFSAAALWSFKFSALSDSISSTCFIHVSEISFSWFSRLETFCWYSCLMEMMRPSKLNDLKRSSAAVSWSRRDRISLACSADFLSASSFSCCTFLISRSSALLTAFN